MAAITLTVETPRGGRGVHRLVESLDAQSLPAGEFDVVFLVDDAGTEIARRLDDLAGRRPNVRVVSIGRQPAAVAALEQAGGDWVMHLPAELLRARVQLRPEALARLRAFADGADCDLVLGRTDVADGALVHDLFVADAARVPATADDLRASAVVLHRREFAATHGLVVDSDSAARAAAATDRVGVLGSYPCAAREDRPDAARGLSLQLAKASASWQDGRLTVSASGSIRGAAATRTVQFSVRHAGSGLEYWLPSEGSSATDGSFTGTATLDVRTAALGAPLPDGVWLVGVGLHGDDHAWSPRRLVPAVSVASAVVDGMVVATPSDAKTMTIDVGATRFSPIRAIDPSDVRIDESAHGTHFVAALPGVAVAGSSRTVGSVLLGKFPLRAELIAEDGRARLECYLSGLSGDSPVATRFGRSKAAPVGLRLDISPVGVMSVRRPTVEQSAPAGGKMQNSAAAAPMARRVRRRVPPRLEPVVQALSRNPTARRVYRRITGD